MSLYTATIKVFVMDSETMNIEGACVSVRHDINVSMADALAQFQSTSQDNFAVENATGNFGYSKGFWEYI